MLQILGESSSLLLFTSDKQSRVVCNFRHRVPVQLSRMSSISIFVVSLLVRGCFVRIAVANSSVVHRVRVLHIVVTCVSRVVVDVLACLARAVADSAFASQSCKPNICHKSFALKLRRIARTRKSR